MPQQQLIWMTLIVVLVIVLFAGYLAYSMMQRRKDRGGTGRDSLFTQEVEDSAEAMRTLAEQIKRADAALGEAKPGQHRVIPCPSCGSQMTAPAACPACGWKNPLWE